MGVKLLEKSKVAELKARDQAREVKEGLKIASRIDSLRELWSSEEQKYEAWKTKSISEVNKEILDVISKKEKLESEVRQLELKKEALELEILDKENGI